MLVHASIHKLRRPVELVVVRIGVLHSLLLLLGEGSEASAHTLLVRWLHVLLNFQDPAIFIMQVARLHFSGVRRDTLRAIAINEFGRAQHRLLRWTGLAKRRGVPILSGLIIFVRITVSDGIHFSRGFSQGLHGLTDRRGADSFNPGA
jgi:hypothetical protein